jgi:hypothetical protein
MLWFGSLMASLLHRGERRSQRIRSTHEDITCSRPFHNAPTADLWVVNHRVTIRAPGLLPEHNPHLPWRGLRIVRINASAGGLNEKLPEVLRRDPVRVAEGLTTGDFLLDYLLDVGSLHGRGAMPNEQGQARRDNTNA